MEDTIQEYNRLWIYIIIIISFSQIEVKSHIHEIHNSSNNEVGIYYGDVFIHNYSKEILKKYDNIFLIDGYLSIGNSNLNWNWGELKFPRLEEISGYLFLFNIGNVTVLKQVFPNLMLIRGHKLFEGYALILHKVCDLEDIEMPHLLSQNLIIQNGGVLIRENAKLCNTKALNSQYLLVNQNSRITIEENKDNCTEDCIGPKDECLFSDYYLNSFENCQTHMGLTCRMDVHCKKTCPSNCSDTIGCFYNTKVHKFECCNEECLGGCDGPTNENCTFCRNEYFMEKCLKTCPIGTLKHRNGRCVTENECIKLKEDYDNFKIYDGQCVLFCPLGFEADHNKGFCMPCNDTLRCQKVCSSFGIRLKHDLINFKNCIIVNGSLIINAQEGIFENDLEHFLGNIEVVRGYVFMFYSRMIKSMNFLKSLRIIQGEILSDGKYALSIMRNPNLEDIFNISERKALIIQNGSIFIQENDRLCVQKIDEFIDWVRIEKKLTVAQKIPHCTHSHVNLSLVEVQINKVEIKLNIFNPHLQHFNESTLYWSLLYREMSEKTIFPENLEYCSANWMLIDGIIETGKTEYFIVMDKLKPFTKYVVYVEVYFNDTGIVTSPFVNFTTDIDVPSPIQNLRILSINSNSAKVVWNVPKIQNGNVTYYLVRYYPVGRNYIQIKNYDYCSDDNRLSIFSEFQSRQPTFLTTLKPNSFKPLTNCIQKCCSCKMEAAKTRDSNFYEAIETLRTNFDYKLKDFKPGFVSTTLIPYYMRHVGEIIDKVQRIGDETQFEMVGLNHFENYHLDIVACQYQKIRGQLCSQKEMINFRTNITDYDVAIDASNMQSIRLNNSFNFNLTWSLPKILNGPLVAFELEMSRKDQGLLKPHFQCITYERYKKKLFEHYELSEGNWVWRVRPVSLAGPGPWTQNIIFIPKNEESTNVPIILLVSFVLTIILMATILIWIFITRRKRSNLTFINSSYIEMFHSMEVPTKDVQILELIGSGSFGLVYKGIWRKKKLNLVVAIKTLPESSGEFERANLLKEAAVMRDFKCVHTLKLLGVVACNNPPLIIVEYMSNGDLKQYLSKHRPNENGVTKKNLPVSEMLEMATEIADGMYYLHSLGFIHRDLAARNCLVSDRKVVKISDFGLARDLCYDDYYLNKSCTAVPIRWMAPEALDQPKFSTMTDIWSYGIVLWEILTLGLRPYHTYSNSEVIEFVKKGGIPNFDLIQKHPFRSSYYNYKQKSKNNFIIKKSLIPLKVTSFINSPKCYQSLNFLESNPIFEEGNFILQNGTKSGVSNKDGHLETDSMVLFSKNIHSYPLLGDYCNSIEINSSTKPLLRNTNIALSDSDYMDRDKKVLSGDKNVRCLDLSDVNLTEIYQDIKINKACTGTCNKSGKMVNSSFIKKFNFDLENNKDCNDLCGTNSGVADNIQRFGGSIDNKLNPDNNRLGLNLLSQKCNVKDVIELNKLTLLPSDYNENEEWLNHLLIAAKACLQFEAKNRPTFLKLVEKLAPFGKETFKFESFYNSTVKFK